MSISLKGKVALVTGGTKGIGNAIVNKLSQAGAQVITTARNNPATTKDFGHHFLKVDHSQADSGDVIKQYIDEKFGKLDIIINNAGANLTPSGGHSVLTDTDWNNEIQLNLMASVRTNKALIPLLPEHSNATIIHISMNPAMQPMWEVTMAYSAVKAALNAYSKALASELGRRGIRVNTVSPGLVKTPQMQNYVEKMAVDENISIEEATKSLLSTLGDVPLNRAAEADEIANLVRFLVSDEASYISGAIYQIDGGSLATI